ncbi:MAG: hypothetical protein AAF449_08625, partial [Myxococcota bacterium]
EEMTVPDILLVHCLGWAKIAGFGEADAPLNAYLDQGLGGQSKSAFSLKSSNNPRNGDGPDEFSLTACLIYSTRH